MTIFCISHAKVDELLNQEKEAQRRDRAARDAKEGMNNETLSLLAKGLKKLSFRQVRSPWIHKKAVVSLVQYSVADLVEGVEWREVILFVSLKGLNKLFLSSR